MLSEESQPPKLKQNNNTYYNFFSKILENTSLSGCRKKQIHDVLEYKGWARAVGEGISEKHVEILEGDEYIHYFIVVLYSHT